MEISGVMVTLRARELPTGEVLRTGPSTSWCGQGEREGGVARRDGGGGY